MSTVLHSPIIKTATLYRAAAGEFLLIFLAGVLVIVAVALGAVHLDNNATIARIEANAAMQVELASKLIGHDFETVTSDLLMLAKTPDTIEFINSGKESDRRRLAEHFQVFAGETRLYDQVRFIHAKGMESVRVNFDNYSSVIVPDDQLQDKSGRYFFRDAFKLAAGQVYVSPLDLNIEHNRLEVPNKPMIRFGTPVFDRSGQKKGIVLLNYFGSVLLQNFKEVLKGEGQRAMLLNREGYWLSSPDYKDEWGFMLGNKRTFGNSLPEEWRVISSTDHGSIAHRERLVHLCDRLSPFAQPVFRHRFGHAARAERACAGPARVFLENRVATPRHFFSGGGPCQPSDCPGAFGRRGIALEPAKRIRGGFAGRAEAVAGDAGGKRESLARN